MRHFPSILESIEDLSKEQVDSLLSLSKKLKGYSQDWEGFPKPFIKKPIIATSFLENSTRTKNSFAVAIEKLGATYIDFNAEASSLKKGESLEETLLTLRCQGIDLCIIRTSVSNELKSLKENPPIKIINAGDGTNQHPTQALLDLFTMIEIGMELEGKTIAIIGDVTHSRVSHSLLQLLPQFGAKVILCGPKDFLPSLTSNNKDIFLTHDRDEALIESDLIYLLRIQKERHGSYSSLDLESYQKNYGISYDLLKKLNLNSPIFHPGPANVGVEICTRTIRSKYYFGYDQVRNSIFMRMAILQSILQNGDSQIGQYCKKRYLNDL